MASGLGNNEYYYILIYGISVHLELQQSIVPQLISFTPAIQKVCVLIVLKYEQKQVYPNYNFIICIMECCNIYQV